MGISVVGAQPESASNDFTLNVGTSGNTTFTLDKTYQSGRYAIAFDNSDSTYDIYAVTAAGSYVGYSNSGIIEISQDFRTLVVLGAANNEKILFTYKGPITTAATKGDIIGAGPYLTEAVTSALPDIDDTTVVNGGNFAADVEIYFVGQDTTETAAKTVVRSSSTQLIVTRPDSFDPDNSPYSLKAVNPGIPSPSGSGVNILSNATTAGTNPVWTTGADIFYNIGDATSITLLATDTEGSDIDYSLVSGSLPAGLSLDGETGVISGTFSGSANEGDVTAITVRATDAGGNFLDKAFNLTANTAPTWTTPAGALTPSKIEESYSYQLAASTGAAGGSLSYSLQAGVLPSGLSLSSAGLISGTNAEAEAGSDVFTVRVTDEGGLFVDREFSIESFTDINFILESSANDTANWQAIGVSPSGEYFASIIVKNSFNAVISLYDSTGGIIWARSTGDSIAYDDHLAIAIDSSNNVYAAINQYNGHYTYVWKIGFDGSTAWSRRINTDSSKPTRPKAIKIVGDYAYVAMSYYVPNDGGSAYASNQGIWAKLNLNDGTVASIWGRRFDEIPGNNRDDYIVGGDVFDNSSTQVEVTSNYQYRDFVEWVAAYIATQNSGSSYWARRLYETGYRVYGMASPVGVGSHLMCGMRENKTLNEYAASIAALNSSSGVLYWKKTLTGGTNTLQGISYDSTTGYFWAAFTDTSSAIQGLGVIAFDTNGNIMLSRKISWDTASLGFFIQGHSIKVVNDSVYVIFRTNIYPITVKMPTNGSVTGTFSFSSPFHSAYNITIAAGSYSFVDATYSDTIFTVENTPVPSNDTTVPALTTNSPFTYTKLEI